MVRAYACGFSALRLAAEVTCTERSKNSVKPDPNLFCGLSIKNELYEMKLSLALALAPVAAFVAPVLLRVEITTKNGALTAKIDASSARR